MKSFFEDSRKRIDRATLHLEAFSDEWKRVINPDTYKLVTEINHDWTNGSIKAVPKVLLENTLALELGEFFYQLRAALDSLIYQTAILLEGTDPPTNEESLYFPMCVKPKTFRESTVNQPPFPKDRSIRSRLRAMGVWMSS